MNWLTLILRSLSLIPVVVAGIEKLHKDAPSETKLQIAKDSLGLSTAVATTILPPNQTQLAQVISDEATNTINATVAAYHADGTFQHKADAPASAEPAPAAQSQEASHTAGQ